MPSGGAMVRPDVLNRQLPPPLPPPRPSGDAVVAVGNESTAVPSESGASEAAAAAVAPPASSSSTIVRMMPSSSPPASSSSSRVSLRPPPDLFESSSLARASTMDRCRCPHLDAILPSLLDATVVRESGGRRRRRRWTVLNPVHRLHLASQLDRPGDDDEDDDDEEVGGLPRCGPYLYGAEEARTAAWTTAGLSESYVPGLIPRSLAEARRAALTSLAMRCRGIDDDDDGGVEEASATEKREGGGREATTATAKENDRGGRGEGAGGESCGTTATMTAVDDVASGAAASVASSSSNRNDGSSSGDVPAPPPAKKKRRRGNKLRAMSPPPSPPPSSASRGDDDDDGGKGGGDGEPTEGKSNGEEEDDGASPLPPPLSDARYEELRAMELKLLRHRRASTAPRGEEGSYGYGDDDDDVDDDDDDEAENEDETEGEGNRDDDDKDEEGGDDKSSSARSGGGSGDAKRHKPPDASSASVDAATSSDDKTREPSSSSRRTLTEELGSLDRPVPVVPPAVFDELVEEGSRIAADADAKAHELLESFRSARYRWHRLRRGDGASVRDGGSRTRCRRRRGEVEEAWGSIYDRGGGGDANGEGGGASERPPRCRSCVRVRRPPTLPRRQRRMRRPRAGPFSLVASDAAGGGGDGGAPHVVSPDEEDRYDEELCEDPALAPAGPASAAAAAAAAAGDELLQCLECSYVGCGGPSSIAGGEDRSGGRHALCHMMTAGHDFAATCGPRTDVYCLRCGDFVYHEAFADERRRIDVEVLVPSLGYPSHPLRRSFEPTGPSSFVYHPDVGWAWRGPVATYPPPVPDGLVEAGRSALRRRRIFNGELEDWGDDGGATTGGGCSELGPKALRLALRQRRLAPDDRWKIPAPVGMHNLGNTCFLTSVLQCLANCPPLQRHFLGDAGHHRGSCEALRRESRREEEEGETRNGGAPATTKEDRCESCLACEMDGIFLEYFGSSIGIDAAAALAEGPLPASRLVPPTPRGGPNGRHDGRVIVAEGEKVGTTTMTRGVVASAGEPIVPSDLLASAWMSGGMDHLAGYDQRDAHEFLQGFLDALGRHDGRSRRIARELRERGRTAASAGPFRPGRGGGRDDEDEEDDSSGNDDIVRRLFEGTLRSVLICETCSCKRYQPEPFLNISLPLSKEMQQLSAAAAAASAATSSDAQPAGGGGPTVSTRKGGANRVKISVEVCLEHFTVPESLADPVHCPSCDAKTPTKKQHSFAKLPRVLCLHLKRFDAGRNRKIMDPVRFPARGLDMGPHLPHWCEVMQGTKTFEKETAKDGDVSSPNVLYDLFGTVNHTGTLHQGHYVSNVKVDRQWYHCNDAVIQRVGTSGNGEKEVLNDDGAYMLFYVRR